jgi:hypothetical protein
MTKLTNLTNTFISDCYNIITNNILIASAKIWSWRYISFLYFSSREGCGHEDEDSLNVRKAMHWIRCFGLVVSDGPGTDITKYARIWDAFVCRLGCPEFTWPVDQPTPKIGPSRSLFIPDSAIYKGHPRFSTLTRNIRQRRGERVAINIPSKYTYAIYL